MQMLARGVMQADVARACEVSRQTVSVWARKLVEDRQAWRRQPLGRPGAIDAEQRKKLSKLLLAGDRGRARLNATTLLIEGAPSFP